ncbi:hypothetical protein ACIA5H_09480 [Nocardia sp. NPDC051900]|uniref:hypothetical protein n=1 Tax=Nocardia sp. NPDC051900 TaxID=3364326 RepID=UPI0037AFBB24
MIEARVRDVESVHAALAARSAGQRSKYKDTYYDLADERLSSEGCFEEHCIDYRFASGGRELLATLVTVPELDGTFIELETIVPEAELAEALEIVRTTLHQLGVADGDLTTEQYTDAVQATRRASGLP